MFTITAFGKTYRFDTIEEATRVANEYFAKTGNLVGIESA